MVILCSFQYKIKANYTTAIKIKAITLLDLS